MHGLNGVQRRPAPGSAPLLRNVKAFPLLSAFLCVLCVSALSLPATELFFAATATDSFGLQSDYSTEIEYDRPIGGPHPITLAWDQCDPGDTYTIYWGRLSGLYTHTVDAGTNLQLTVILCPPPLTNVLITVTGQALEWSSDPLAGKWSALTTLDSGLWTRDFQQTTWAATNPPAPALYFRGQPAAIQILHY